MIIGAYQFVVNGKILENYKCIRRGIMEASKHGVRLLVFPECALTGYPPRDIHSSGDVDDNELDFAYREIERLSKEYDMYILVGMIKKECGEIFNSAVLFSPDKESCSYRKRALWGWDNDNFVAGDKNGIFEIDGIKMGVRICFEVRFPEYFRELYREQTALNIVMFYDVSDNDDMERYELIKAHIRTRAVENVTYTLTVNSIYPYQTAPTGIYDKSGYVIDECDRNQEDLLVFDFNNSEDDFGEKGRRMISNQLTDNLKVAEE